MNKITVVVDLDDTEMLEEHGSLERGVYGVDRDGVYHMCYYNEFFGTVKTYLVGFSPPKSCEYCSHNTCDCEEIIDQNIQAQERTGQQ